ncbi:MAG: zinc-ribbon domain-containing protein [Atopobiaceae bacterium]|nr:zinc-ribbon domain-containing protein [Atopobiaceae bacterium]
MFCPNCGVIVQPGQHFCANCGQRLDEIVTAEEAPTPVEEAKQEVIESQAAPEIVTDEPVEVTAVFEQAIPVEEVTPHAEEAEQSVEPLELEEIEVTQVRPAARPIEEQVVAPAPQQVVPAPQQQSVPAPQQPAPAAQQYAQSVSGAPVPPPSLGTSQTGTQPNPQQQVPVQPMPQAQPATAQKQRWYASPLAKVAIGAIVVFSIARCGASILVRNMSSNHVEKPEPLYEPIENEDIDDILNEIDEDTNSITVQSPAPNSEAAKMFESHGYPTLNTFMELTGKELSDLILDNGYEYYDGDDVSVFVKRDGTIVFNAVDTNGYISRSAFEALSKGGMDEGVAYVAILEGFSGPEAVLNGIAGCAVEDQKSYGDYETLAIVYGPSMTRYLVDIYDVEDGDYEVDLYSPKAIANGLFDTANDGSYGSTVEEVFKNYELSN